jgi:hypothetical protein
MVDTTATASWQPDPWGRHQYRWHDGHVWTDSVANNGTVGIDPPVALEAPRPPAVPVPTLPSPAPTQAAHYQLPAMTPTGQQASPLPRKKPKGGGRRIARGLLVCVLILLGLAVAIVAVAPPAEDEAVSTEANQVPLLLGADATHQERSVDALSFGDEWPLMIETGTLVCESVPAPIELLNVFIVEPNGATYAINGTARGTIETHGWQDFESIWKTDPAAPDLKVNISPLINAGLEICEPALITDEPLPEDLADAVTDVTWAMSTPEEQVMMCESWSIVPGVFRDAFIASADGNADYWPALERLLVENC